jgi:hypothetical protein
VCATSRTFLRVLFNKVTYSVMLLFRFQVHFFTSPFSFLLLWTCCEQRVGSYEGGPVKPRLQHIRTRLQHGHKITAAINR